jgi:hypothetical protein
MTSKKLSALLRSVPPATANPQEMHEPSRPPVISEPSFSHTAPQVSVAREVPLQVLIPEHIRKKLGVKAAEEGRSLRELVLLAIRGLGIEVTEGDIKGKRGRRNS